ncbi:glycosyltransferase [Phragmitibacter flavus]|uniref:Glycosyltransferase n=1 Tax=Phragmitibacter flavus TaxID=2576071 RepID=A0A5R8K7W1_9BACT|nr:glycosyltransferase [Phragmitibacter flavus]TLD68421.1 glycosyltransferase [Phragmitibacter flavus]
MSPLKILHVAPCHGGFGGIEAFTLRLAEELHSQGQFASVGFKRVKNFKLLDSLTGAIEASPVNATFIDRGSDELKQLIAGADVVHLHNPTPDATLFAKLAGKPLVVTIYNRFGRGGWMHRVLWKLAARCAHRRWYISDFVWSTWEPGRRRTGSGKMPIISNLPSESVPPHERRGFIFVGRWIENKGLEELLEAYARAGLDPAVWPLTLVGFGPLEDRVQALIDKHQLRGVIRPGFVSDAERNDMIRRAKWMVTPPNTKEDLGLTPIESRHVGVPAIITRDGGLPEAGGRHSLICEPGDVAGLQRLLEQAAAMPEDEYVKLSEVTRAELMEYLQPLSVYLDSYRELMTEFHGGASKLTHQQRGYGT